MSTTSRLASAGALILAMAVATAGCGTGRADYIRHLQSEGVDTGTSGGGNGGDGPGTAPGDPGATEAPVLAPDPAQFGVQLDTFFGAGAMGMYDAAVGSIYEKLAVEAGFLPGTPDQDPIDAVMAEDGPQIYVGSVPAVLVAREQRQSDLVLVALLYQRSGSLLVGPKGTSVKDLAKLKGGTIGLLGIGDRSLDVKAALALAGLIEGDGYMPAGDYDFVMDPATSPAVELLRSGGVTAMAATSYDEYAQLLEFGSSDGQPAYGAKDLAVRSLDATGDAMVATGVFARASWLKDPKNQNALVRFLEGAFQGYAECRDQPADCAQLVVDQGAPLPVGHQLWAVNEINALIWPAPDGIGSMDIAAYNSTVDRLVKAGLLAAAPAADAVDLGYAEQARTALAGVDLAGAGFTRTEAPITPNGEGANPAPTDASGDGG